MNINGGATLWARQTIDSEIFYNKSDVWFKIWFYLVNRVNYKDDKRFKRGSCFFKYEWIMNKTGATYNQVKHCLEYLKHATQIATQKKTRGLLITVINYDLYQTLDNYHYEESHTERKTEAKQKPNRSHTILKKEKNDKNVKNEDKRDASRSQIIEYLNKVTHSKYKSNTPVSVKHINARLKEGFVWEDFKYVVDVKWVEWGGKFTKEGKSMEDWMRPITLFGPKFEGYLNQEKPDNFEKYLKKEE